jgi:hypothetical protein
VFHSLLAPKITARIICIYVAFVLALRGGIIIEGASVADFADEQKNSTTLPQMLRCTPHPTIEMILLQRWGDNLMASLSPIQTRTFPALSEPERCISARAEIIIRTRQFRREVSSYRAFSILINSDAAVYPIISADWKSVGVDAVK